MSVYRPSQVKDCVLVKNIRNAGGALTNEKVELVYKAYILGLGTLTRNHTVGVRCCSSGNGNRIEVAGTET